MYEKDSWEAYLNEEFIDAFGDSYTRTEIKNLLKQYDSLENGTPKKNRFFTNTNDFSTIGENGVSRGSTSDDIADTLKTEIEPKLTNVTTLTPGKEVVVAAYASTNDGSDIFSIQVVLDITDMVAPDSVNFYVKPGYEDDINVVPYNRIYSNGILVAMGYASPDEGVFGSTDVLVGAVGFTLSSNVSSSSVIKYFDDATDSLIGQTMFGFINDVEQAYPTRNIYPENFAEEQLTFTSQAQSNNTELDSLTVDGNNALNGTGPSYSCSTPVSDGTANISATVKDNGSILSPAYIYKQLPSIPAAGGSAPSGYVAQASVVSGNFSYDLTNITTGDTVYALFQAQASDNTTVKWYLVSFTKAKSTESKANITFSSSDSLTWQTNFSNGTTGPYTIYYNPSATNFKVNVTPLDSTVSSMTFSENNYALSSGVDYEFCSSTMTDGKTYKVEVVSQAGGSYKTTYEFKFVAANTKPNSVTADGTVTGSYDVDNKTFTLDPMKPGQGSFNLNINLPSGATAELKLNGQVKANYNGTGTKNLSYTETDNSKATSETYTLEVTNNGVTDTYTIIVNRPLVDNDKSFTIINATYVDPDGNSHTLNLTKENGSNTYSNVNAKIPYNSKSVTYTVKLADGSQTKIYAGQNNQGNIITNTPQTHNLTAGSQYTTETFSFYLQTALDQVNGTGTKWDVKIYEETPNTTKILTNLDLYSVSHAGNVPSSDRTVSNKDYTYTIDTSTYGTTFLLDLSWTDATKTKAYISESPISGSQGTVLNTAKYDASNKPSYTLPQTGTKTIYVYLQDEALNYDEYRVIIQKGKSRSCDIDNIAIAASSDGNNFNQIFGSYSSTTLTYHYNTYSGLKLPYQTKSIKFTITLNQNSQNAVVTINGNSTNGTGQSRTYTYTLTGTGDISIPVVCTSEAGTTYQKTYNFTLNRATGSTNNDIKTIVISGIDCTNSANNKYFKNNTVFSNSTTNFTLYIPCNEFTTNSNVQVTLDSVYSQATYVPASGSSGTFNASSANGGIFSFNYHTNLAKDQKYTFTIIVKSEVEQFNNGNGKTYTFNVYIASQEHELDDFDVKNDQGALLQDSSNNIIEKANYQNYTSSNPFVVNNSVSKIQIDVTTPNDFCNGKISYNGNSSNQIILNAGVNKITITVDAELLSKDATRTDLRTTYVFYIKRDTCNHNNKLSSLSANIDGAPVAFDKTFSSGQNVYLIENLTAGSQITFYFTLADSTSNCLSTGNVTVSGQTLQITDLNYNDQTNPSSQTFTIDIGCNCGTSTNTYKITLSTKQVTISSNPGTITSIVAATKPDGYTADQLSPTFTSTNLGNYTVNLTNNRIDDSVKFDVISNDSPDHIGYIELKEGSAVLSFRQTTSFSYTFNGINYGDTKTFTITIYAEDSTTVGSTYTIVVKRAQQASTDDEPTMFYYNNIQVPGYSKTNYGPYVINIGTQTSVQLSADLPTGASFKQDQAYNDFVLNAYQFGTNEWSKTVTVYVQAQDPNESAQGYTFIIYREGLKELDDLKAEVEDSSGNLINKLNPSSFSAAQKNYTVSLTSTQNEVLLTWLPKANNGNVIVQLIDPQNNIIGNLIQNADGSYSYKIRNIQTTFDPLGNDTPLKYTLRLSETINGTVIANDYEVAISKDRGSDVAYITNFEYIEQPSGQYIALSNATFYIQGQTTYDKNNGLYYRVDRNINVFNPKITLNDSNAKYILPQNTRLIPGQVNHMRITVIPASGVDPTGGNNHSYVNAVYYDFDVYPCDITFDIDNVFALEYQGGNNLLDLDGQKYIDYANNVLNITISYNAANSTYLDVKVKNTTINHKIYLNGSLMSSATQNLNVGLNTFKLTIKSEYAHAYFVENNSSLPNNQYETQEIEVKITKNAKSTDNYLKELYVEYTDNNGVQRKDHLDQITLPNGDIVLNNSNFILGYLGDGITNVKITATPNYSGATISGDGNYDLSTLITDAQTGNYILTVVCTAEDGSKKFYKILIPSSNVNLAEDNSITEIIVTDSTGNTHLSNQTTPKKYEPTIDEYGVYKIPYSASSYTITVKTPTGALSTVTIDGQNGLTMTENITANMRGTTKTVIVYCTSQNPNPGKGTEYKINLEFEEGSKENKLDQLLADNTLVPNFSSTNPGPYELTRPNNTTYIDISYLQKDSNSKVSISGADANGRVNLVEGVNTITVTVIPEDSTAPSMTYTINVLREHPLPYLTDLKTTDGYLLDTNNKVTTFEKTVYYYNTIVPYYVDITTIQAFVDNSNYVVSCNNTSKTTDSPNIKEFEASLKVGANNYVLTVSSPEGKQVEYYLTITRRPQSSMDTGVNSMEIIQIPVFKTEYTDSNRQYKYQVPNGIRELDVKVDLYKKADSTGDGATYKIINGRESGVFNADEKVTLRVGNNTLIVLVIAEDGETTRAVEVEVYREPMSFDIDSSAYANENVTCSKVENTNNQNIYKVDLGDKRASDISDWTKFITFDDTKYDKNNGYELTPDIEILSDTSNKNCNEVIVRLYDGDEEVFVTFSLESDAIGGFSISELVQIIIPWILLLVAIILLIAILVCVNRDKYGSINKRRKKDEVTE